MTFTDNEIDYLRGQKLARIATVSAEGQPDNVAVTFEFDGEYFWIGGFDPTHTRRTGNIQAGNDKVALLVDDLAPGRDWSPRFVRVYGVADLVERPAGSGTLIMRIAPAVSWSMNLDGAWSPDSGPAPAPRRTMH